MEDFLRFMQYVRIAAFISLFAFSVFALRKFFSKQRLFGLGLCLTLGLLLIITAISYFIGVEASQVVAAIGFTFALVAWAIAWAVDLAYYEDNHMPPED